jgi:hypothetical protein
MILKCDLKLPYNSFFRGKKRHLASGHGNGKAKTEGQDFVLDSNDIWMWGIRIPKPVCGLYLGGARSLLTGPLLRQHLFAKPSFPITATQLEQVASF